MLTGKFRLCPLYSAEYYLISLIPLIHENIKEAYKLFEKEFYPNLPKRLNSLDTTPDRMISKLQVPSYEEIIPFPTLTERFFAYECKNFRFTDAYSLLYRLEKQFTKSKMVEFNQPYITNSYKRLIEYSVKPYAACMKTFQDFIDKFCTPYFIAQDVPCQLMTHYEGILGRELVDWAAGVVKTISDRYQKGKETAGKICSEINDYLIKEFIQSCKDDTKITIHGIELVASHLKQNELCFSGPKTRILVGIDDGLIDVQSLYIKYEPEIYDTVTYFFPTKFIAANVSEQAAAFLRYDKDNCFIQNYGTWVRYEYKLEELNGSGISYEKGSINDALATVIANYYNHAEDIAKANHNARESYLKHCSISQYLRVIQSGY